MGESESFFQHSPLLATEETTPTEPLSGHRNAFQLPSVRPLFPRKNSGHFQFQISIHLLDMHISCNSPRLRFALDPVSSIADRQALR